MVLYKNFEGKEAFWRVNGQKQRRNNVPALFQNAELNWS